ncbi:hypothetical protein D4R51_03735 [bacterium]|nr:MAG: hypothetical protein D4R51_03735 [bacterium]
MGGSDNVTASQLKDFFRKIDEGSITKHILRIFLDNGILKNEDVIDLLKKLAEQDKYIGDLRDVLRFCARNDVGTYYQQESASKILQGTKLVWSDHNPDGTFTQKGIDWVHRCGGEKAVAEVLEYEKKLLSLKKE